MPQPNDEIHMDCSDDSMKVKVHSVNPVKVSRRTQLSITEKDAAISNSLRQPLTDDTGDKGQDIALYKPTIEESIGSVVQTHVNPQSYVTTLVYIPQGEPLTVSNVYFRPWEPIISTPINRFPTGGYHQVYYLLAYQFASPIGAQISSNMQVNKNAENSHSTVEFAFQPPPSSGKRKGTGFLKSIKNKKGRQLTKEMRMEANKRERGRVHVIGKAFETLRKCIPSHSADQRFCKLSILKIAQAYILSLSALAENNQQEFESHVKVCSNIIQAEERNKRRGPSKNKGRRLKTHANNVSYKSK